MPRLSKYTSGYEGKRYKRWTVFCFAYSRPESYKSNAFLWVCQCDCGTWDAINIRLLERGHSGSCGCLKSELGAERMRQHGHIKRVNGKKTKTPEYNSWDHMRQRTTNPKHNHSWHRYGGRGIVVCKGFQKFPAFIRLIGLKPSLKHSVDRINNNGNYSCGECSQCLTEAWPMNVRWATAIEQAANTCRAPQYQ